MDWNIYNVIMSRLVVNLGRRNVQYNVTRIQFTINTNRSVKTETEYFANADRLQNLVYTDLFGDTNSAEEVFGKAPVVREITLTTIGVEAGKKFHRLHMHFTLEITHSAARYSANKAAGRLKSWLDQNGNDLSNGWYVHAKLQRTNDENYNNKEGRKVANADMLRQETEEVTRVSDGRGLNEFMQDLQI